MDFSIPEHFTTGVLNGDDLIFFYYDICLNNLQDLPEECDWDSIVEEFKGLLDIDTCNPGQVDENFVLNRIRFTVSNQKNSDNGSKPAAFFRHLRNAFAHYHVVREGENYVIVDKTEKHITMQGLINAELLKAFCFRCFELREQLMKTH